VAHLDGHKKLPLTYPLVRKSSKSTQAHICSRQARELVALRAEIAALRAAALKPAPAPDAGKIASREEAKVKLAAEIAAAKLIHAELAALEKAEAPERARLQAAWETELRETRRIAANVHQRKYRADDPEKSRATVRRRPITKTRICQLRKLLSASADAKKPEKAFCAVVHLTTTLKPRSPSTKTPRAPYSFIVLPVARKRTWSRPSRIWTFGVRARQSAARRAHRRPKRALALSRYRPARRRLLPDIQATARPL
jgi:hypothetical protein